MKLRVSAVFVIAFAAVAGVPVSGQMAAPPPRLADFKKLSLEDLLEVKVTSVSRRAEPASRAAAAVDVITTEQIERTGATSIQDALRLAPGVQVSRFGGHSYAISSRGFASLAANKLQVMQDGRSLYSPLFSGVFWEAYGTMLEDVERVEVIRGPGATMWGANAVNGVINIITKDARDTQGTLITAGGGTEEKVFGAVRHGGQIGVDTHYRVYGRAHRRDSMALPNGSDALPSPSEQQAGFRIDTRRGSDTHATLQGDYFFNESEATQTQDSSNRDVYVLGRWAREFDASSGFQLQGYVDRFDRKVPGQMSDRRTTFDVDTQYHTKIGSRHELIVGADYRVSSDDTSSTGTIRFVPSGRTTSMIGAFVQDEITLLPARLALVIGSKFQWDSLDGFEPQPNLRAIWTPDERHTVWAAAARAVRMPTRIDEDLRFVPNPANSLVAIRGNPDFAPEKLTSFEVGYRFRPMPRLFVDLAGYVHDYDDLRSLEPTLPTGIPLVQFNRLEARTKGLELAVKLELASWWRVTANYTYLDRDLQPRADSRDPNRGTLEGNDAPRLASLWSAMDLGRNLSLDLVVRHVGPLPQPAIAGYNEADVQLAWRPSAGWRLALVGQNLFDRQHLEFGTPSPATAEVQRGFYAKATWRF